MQTPPTPATKNSQQRCDADDDEQTTTTRMTTTKDTDADDDEEHRRRRRRRRRGQQRRRAQTQAATTTTKDTNADDDEEHIRTRRRRGRRTQTQATTTTTQTTTTETMKTQTTRKRGAFGVVELANTTKNEHIGAGHEYGTEESDSVDCVPEVTHSDSENGVSSPIKCESTKLRSSVGICCRGFSGLSSAPCGTAGRVPSVMYESSSMCSTDSVPLGGTCLNHNNLKSYSRMWNYGSKSTSEATDLACETLSQPLYALSIVEDHENQKSGPPMEVRHSNNMGYPTVTFPRKSGESLVSDYKLTLIGNFSYRMPKMKQIRADFRAQNPLNGQVKIRHCTYRQVLLLFTNEEDYYTVLYKKTFILAGALMQISCPSPDFHHEAFYSYIYARIPRHCSARGFVY